MRILHVAANVSPQSAGGRLCTALRKAGTQVLTLSQTPPAFTEDAFFFLSPEKRARQDARLRSRLGKLPLLLHPGRDKRAIWSGCFFGYDLAAHVQGLQPDLVHLHWIAASCVSLRSLARLSVPVVWTFHDVWPLTACCHCNYDCEEWKNGCKHCVPLGPGIAGARVARRLWNYKRKAYANIPVFVGITPSRWMHAFAGQSPLLAGRRVDCIGNALDTNVFSPQAQAEARAFFSLPQGKKIIAFGANGVGLYHKGFDLLRDALHSLVAQGADDLHLLIFGDTSGLELSLPCPSTCTGWIADSHVLAQAYSAADVFVSPSRQESLGYTFMEASACEVPSVGFAIGGVPDIVRHQETGYLARPFVVEDLAHGIQWATESKERKVQLGQAARQHVVAHFAEESIARRHLDLYTSLLHQ